MESSSCSSSSSQTLALKVMTLITLLLIQIHLSVQVERERSHLGSLSDKILKLPGQPQVGFQQFSGYVPVDAENQRALFYYLVEAEIQPETKPLVLWLNGGNHAMEPYLFRLFLSLFLSITQTDHLYCLLCFLSF